VASVVGLAALTRDGREAVDRRDQALRPSPIACRTSGIATKPPPLDPSVPPGLREIVARCLEKDPDARFSSAKELARALGSGLRRWSPSPRSRSRRTRCAPARARQSVHPRPRPGRPRPRPRAPASRSHPPPKSASPEALAAYASALQSFRDGSLAFAGSELLRATKLDPQLAAAHLRLVVIQPLTHSATIAREHFAAAVQQRSLLEPRDLAILRAAEELIRESPRYDVYASGMEGVAKKHPDDAEVLWMYGPRAGARALDKRATLGVAGTHELEETRAQADLWGSLLVGDFVAAEAAANALSRVYEVETGEDVHAIPTVALIDLLEESGQPERATSVAEAFERRLPAWTPNAPGMVRARLVAMRARGPPRRSRRGGRARRAVRRRREGARRRLVRQGAHRVDHDLRAVRLERRRGPRRPRAQAER
jgi:hypothetical protein